MNDRFKFRVWDTFKNKYSVEDWLPMIDEQGDLCFRNTDDVVYYPPTDQFIIEQCTGLKDKNGNLIYEGDIIQNSDKDQYVVEWCIDGYWYIRQADDEKFGCALALASIKTLYDGWEIISNIHEQAEQKDVK